MDEFKKLTTVAKLSPEQCMTAVVNESYIAVFNVDGAFNALDGNCPHQGGLLGNGTLDGCVVKCPEHGLALFNVDGTIYAINDTCAHLGSSLATGRLQGKVVTCPSHGWRYDLTTGHLSTVPGFGVASYPVQVVEGKIMVAVT